MERNDFWRLAELAEQIAATSDEELIAATRMRNVDDLEDGAWSLEMLRDDLGEAPHPIEPERAFVLEQVSRMLTAYRRALLERRIRQGELFATDAALIVCSPRERRSNRRFARGSN